MSGTDFFGDKIPRMRSWPSCHSPRNPTFSSFIYPSCASICSLNLCECRIRKSTSVFLTFLVGNDFLPHLPALDIRDGAFDLLLFDTYKKQRTGWGQGQYLIFQGEICAQFASKLIWKLRLVASRPKSLPKRKTTMPHIRRRSVVGTTSVIDDHMVQRKLRLP